MQTTIFTVLLGILCCFAICNAQQQGWYQTDGSPNRNRYSDYSTNSYSPSYKSHNLNVIPNSLVQHRFQKRTYGLAVENKDQTIVRFGPDGTVTKVLAIPKEFELVDVLPVLDNDEAYYTVRKNTTNNSYFVLRSVVSPSSTPTHYVLFDTKTLNQITSLVLTNSGLVIVSGNYLVCVNPKTGSGKWTSTIVGGSTVGSQLLVDGSNLYALTSASISLIDMSNGKAKVSTALNTTVSLATAQNLMIVGNYLVVFDKASYYNRVIVFDRNNLTCYNTVKMVFLNGANIDFDKCSNAMSIGTTNSFE